MLIFIFALCYIIVISTIITNNRNSGSFKNSAKIINLNNNKRKLNIKTNDSELPHKIPNFFNKNDTFYTVANDCQIYDLVNIYERVFGQIYNGTFVEFGAYDGEFVSNTCGLADMGWKGVYIEPIPEMVEKCTNRHKNNLNTTVVSSAVGPEEKDVTLHIGGALSTIDDDHVVIFNNTDWSKGQNVGQITINVKQRLLHDILITNNIKPGFELLVVDIEGFEWEALRNFDINYWHPTMVIIEIEDEHETFQNREDIIGIDGYNKIRRNFKNLREYFQNAQYEIISKDHINTVYVRAK